MFIETVPFSTYNHVDVPSLKALPNHRNWTQGHSDFDLGPLNIISFFETK